MLLQVKLMCYPAAAGLKVVFCVMCPWAFYYRSAAL